MHHHPAPREILLPFLLLPQVVNRLLRRGEGVERLHRGEQFLGLVETHCVLVDVLDEVYCELYLLELEVVGVVLDVLLPVETDLLVPEDVAEASVECHGLDLGVVIFSQKLDSRAKGGDEDDVVELRLVDEGVDLLDLGEFAGV